MVLFDESLKDAEKPLTKQAQKDLKYKIYDVCKLIYEEQRIAGAQL